MNEIEPAHCPIAGNSWFFLPFLPSSAWQGILDCMCQEHGSVRSLERPPLQPHIYEILIAFSFCMPCKYTAMSEFGK